MAKPTQKQKITDELFTDLCSRIACGELLCDLCQEYGFTRVWFWKWVNQDQERINAYACARIEQQHTFADEILKIADDSTNDTCTKTSKSGDEYDACDNEWINRARVRIDTRKFLMARIAAKDYGDKIQTEISGKDGGPIQTTQIVVHRGKAPKQ
jgi:hypothetical protein